MSLFTWITPLEVRSSWPLLSTFTLWVPDNSMLCPLTAAFCVALTLTSFPLISSVPLALTVIFPSLSKAMEAPPQEMVSAFPADSLTVSFLTSSSRTGVSFSAAQRVTACASSSSFSSNPPDVWMVMAV